MLSTLESRDELVAYVAERSCDHGLARAPRELDPVMHGVHGREPHREQLTGREEMTEIGAREAAAGRAVALGIERPLVVCIDGVLHHETSRRGEDRPSPVSYTHLRAH